jgi:hypothetical protein
LDENGDLLSFEQLKLKYNIKSTFIDVIRLHKAIPPKWLYTIESEVTYIGARPSITPAVQSVISVLKGCKLFYHKFNNTQTNTSILSQGKWSRDLHSSLEVDDWKHSYILPFQTSIETNLRYFQYRILHRILTTNRCLFIVKIADNDLCWFCSNASESIVHLCVHCEFVEDVWLELHAWLVKNCHIQLN